MADIWQSKQSALGQGLPSSLKSSGGHAPREASGGAYTMFDPQQVKQFKEAFAMIDQDGDGRVTEEDLKTMLSSLGESLASERCSLVSAVRSGQTCRMGT